MTSKLVALRTVARRFRLSVETLQQWGKNGRLTIVVSGNKQCCYEHDIDRILKKGNKQSPTWSEIVANKIRFLTSKEVEKALRLSQPSVYRLGQNGDLAFVYFGKDRRYTAASVKARRLLLTRALSLKETEHILGITTDWGIRILEQEGRLTAVRLAGNRVEITLDSVLSVLADFLPDWISPSTWIEIRQGSTCGFVAATRLAWSAHDRDRIATLLKEGKMLYIRPVIGGKSTYTLIPTDSSLEYCARFESPHATPALALLFGVSRQLIKEWDEDIPGWRDCPLHSHPDATLYTTCVVKVLSRYVQRGAGVWYTNVRHKKDHVMDEAETMRLLGVSNTKELRDIVQQYHVSFLVTPDQQRRYLHKAIKKLRGRLDRAARSD